jgi:arylsulfatase A-like enzyme
MIIKWPGMQSNAVDRGLHCNADLAPTVAEIFGIPAWNKWNGTSYAQTLRDGSDCGHDELILSQCAHVCQRAVRWDNMLYIKTYHDGYHPHFKDEMLFDIAKDPHETENLTETMPESRAEGARRLDAWHDSMMQSMPFGYTIDPMDTVLQQHGPFHANSKSAPIAEYKKRLLETDRGHWIETIAKKHPEFR